VSTIGMNLLWLVPGVVGGSEEYTVRLLRAFDDLGCDDLELRLYAQPSLLDAHPDLADRFETRTCPPAGSKAVRIALEHTWLATVTRHDALVHHGGGVVPCVRSCPAIVTVHDLQPLDHPDHFALLKRRWLAAMIPYSVRVARLVVCPSQFTADAVCSRFDVSRERVEVVHQGYTPDGSPEPNGGGAVEGHDPDPGTAGRRRWRAPDGRFLLFPAIAYPHKRHTDLITALHLLRDRFADLSVVFTGRPGPESERLAAQAAALGLSDRLHVLGRVPAEELDALYHSATALVFPSAYEGFGNPVLEAMARGCPVVTTDATALPEVVGDAGLLVPVGEPRALAEAIARVLDEPGLASTLAAAGRERATHFSWERAGSRLADCYRRAVQLAG
jgi:alpha-1,3-rhamnosyl/mannosyltransferase